jgi:hypothetical protein
MLLNSKWCGQKLFQMSMEHHAFHRRPRVIGHPGWYAELGVTKRFAVLHWKLCLCDRCILAEVILSILMHLNEQH